MFHLQSFQSFRRSHGRENERRAESLCCRSGAVTAALKSSAAASQAQGAVKKAQSESVSGSEGVGALRVERCELFVRELATGKTLASNLSPAPDEPLVDLADERRREVPQRRRRSRPAFGRGTSPVVVDVRQVRQRAKVDDVELSNADQRGGTDPTPVSSVQCGARQYRPPAGAPSPAPFTSAGEVAGQPSSPFVVEGPSRPTTLTRSNARSPKVCEASRSTRGVGSPVARQLIARGPPRTQDA